MAIYDGCGRVHTAPLFGPDSRPKNLVNCLPETLLGPSTEILVHSLPLGKVMRQLPPLTPRSHYIEDGVDDLSSLIFRRVWTRLGLRDEVFYQLPLLVGEVGRVRRSALALIGFHAYDVGTEVQVDNLLDFTMTAFAVPVASPRLAEAFTRVAGTALQCIPARIGHREGYKILVATRLVRCLDERRSDFLKWTEADGRPDRTGSYRMVTKLHIDATMVPPDTHIFRIADWDGALIISSEMVAAAKAIGATGLKLTPVD